MRHSALLLLTCLLALTTAWGLLLAGVTLSPPPRETASLATPRDTDEANLALIRRFYAAVNATLRTGDAAQLTALLAPDFVDRVPVSGDDSTATGLIRYLLELRASYPTAWFAADDVRAEGDWVVSQVRLGGTTRGTLLGIPATGGPVLWSATELYHVAGNRIAERWCACLWPVLPEVLARAELAAPPNAMLVRLVRLVVAPGEVQPHRSFGSSILLAVEAGVLDVKTGGLAAAAGSATGEGRQPVASGDDHVVAAGDHLLISSGTSLAFHNGGGAAAVALALAMLPFDADARDGLTFRWPDGAPPAETATVLVDGAVSRLPAGMATVTLGRMTLPAGVDLSPSVTTGPQLVFVESGDLQVVSPAEHASLVSAGQGGFVPLEDVRALRSTGEAAVVFLAVTIESAGP